MRWIRVAISSERSYLPLLGVAVQELLDVGRGLQLPALWLHMSRRFCGEGWEGEEEGEGEGQNRSRQHDEVDGQRWAQALLTFT